MPEHLAQILVTGVGATLFMDLALIARRRLWGTPMLDYRLVGRWLAGLPQGRLVLDADARSCPMPGEFALGWGAHYAIGVAFAAVLIIALGGLPGFAPSILFGLLTALAPYLVLQPALGLGVAASRAPRPAVARINTLIAHSLFGLGIYLSALPQSVA